MLHANIMITNVLDMMQPRVGVSLIVLCMILNTTNAFGGIVVVNFQLPEFIYEYFHSQIK